jgi:lysozyme
MNDLATQLVQHFEGCRLTAYQDTRGFWTIGWGHLLKENQDWTGYTISQAEADQLRSEDLEYARMEATGFPNYLQMNDVRRAVLVSMCFQLGSKPLFWPNFMASLEVQDWAGAATNGLDSDWARQTPSRAICEMNMLETGVWAL